MRRRFSTILMVLFITNCLFSSYGECAQPSSYAYVLQADQLSEEKSEAVAILKNCGRELIVIDPFFTNDTRWSKKDIAEIRSGMPRRKVVAYLSIGEAEIYRNYWQRSWCNPDTKPDYILEENPNWAGNYKVKYWREEWKRIIFTELENIVQAGFDGIFLDIVDAFEYFEADGDEGYTDYKVNNETGNSYRSDMIEFVKQLRKRLDTLGKTDYLIIPQNGSQLLESQVYQDTISMQALEDLFTVNDKKQPKEHSDYILSFLESLKNNGKGVIVTEYPKKKKYRDIAVKGAKQNNLTLLMTSRALNSIGDSRKP